MLTFLQLSDIHFRNLPDESPGDPPDSERDEVQDYSQRESLIKDARAIGRELGGYSAVLVAGDIANSGDPEQFSQASAWLRNLCTAIEVKPWMVWTIPGNHDVDDERIGELEWDLRNRLRDADEDALDALLEAIQADGHEGPRLIGPLENYIEFADSFACAFSTEQLYWTCDLALSDTHPLQLRGVSSALLCAKGDEREERRTVIGQKQASGWDGTKLHLSMCHHPHSYLLDREEIDQAFKDRVQVRVTGHLHHRILQLTDIGIYLQAGALSPKRGRDGNYHAGYEPTYDIITLKQTDRENMPFLEIGVHQRVWQDQDRRWVAGEQTLRRFAVGRDGAPEILEQPPTGIAEALEIPEREVRYKLAQLPLTDKYDRLERIGAPIAEFIDVPEFRLVSSILSWAEDNEKLDALATVVVAGN